MYSTLYKQRAEMTNKGPSRIPGPSRPTLASPRSYMSPSTVHGNQPHATHSNNETKNVKPETHSTNRQAAKYSPSKSTVKKRKEGQPSSTGGTWSQEKQERPQVQKQSQQNNRLTAQNLLGKDKKNEPYNAYPNDVVADREAGRNDTGGWTDSSSPSYFPRSRSLSPSQSSDSSVSPSDPTAIPTISLSTGSDKHASSRDLSAKRAIVTRNEAANRPLTSDIPIGGEREHQAEVTSKFQQVLQEKVEECEKRLQDKIEACEKEFHEKFQVSKTELQEKVKEHEVELERKEDTYKKELRQMKEECKTAWEFHLDALYRNSDMDQRLEDAGKMVRERDAKIHELGAESASKSKLVESLKAQQRESDDALAKMQAQLTETKSLQSQLGEKDRIVEGLNSQLKIESTENESLQSQLEEQDRIFDVLKDELTSHSTENDSLQCQLEEKDDIVECLTAQLKNKSTEIMSLRSQRKGLRVQLRSMRLMYQRTRASHILLRATRQRNRGLRAKLQHLQVKVQVANYRLAQARSANQRLQNPLSRLNNPVHMHMTILDSTPPTMNKTGQRHSCHSTRLTQTQSLLRLS